MKDIDKETQIPVLLSICSEQLFEGQEPDHIELITEGTLELLPDGLRFFYQETELTGMEGTTTSFQLCGPQVILSRTGAVNSQMVFEEGRQHTSLYETPFGAAGSGRSDQPPAAQSHRARRTAGPPVFHRHRARRHGPECLQNPHTAPQELGTGNLLSAVRNQAFENEECCYWFQNSGYGHEGVCFLRYDKKEGLAMTNMIQEAKNQAAALAMAAYCAAAADGTLPKAEVKEAPVEIPRDAGNGDFTTTFALAASKTLRKPPREIAQALLDHMNLTGSWFDSAEIAGPGFLNFRLNHRWFEAVCKAVETEGASYGTGEDLKGQKIMVEFVSANPTGPMHMGNARGGVLGDTLASVLEACGAEVSREFYVNDAGHQIDKFARSIYARCMQKTLGEENYPFPEDGYQGDDIRELAEGFLAQAGEFPGGTSEDAWMTAMAEYGLSVNLPKMKADLQRYKINYDTWFYESTLHNSGDGGGDGGAADPTRLDLRERGRAVAEDGGHSAGEPAEGREEGKGH